MFRGATQLGRVALMGVVLQIAAETANGGLLPRGTVIRDATLPLYKDPGGQPCGLIHIGSLRTDYQTHGFFRIGALPAVKAQQVDFEIVEPGALRAVLQQSGPAVLEKGSRRSLELRGVTFRITGETKPRLTAPLIRLTQGGDWDLVDGCRLREWGESADWIALPRSRLVVSGEDVGTVRTTVNDEVRVHHPFPPSPSVPVNTPSQGNP